MRSNSIRLWQEIIGEWHRSIFGEHDPHDHVKAIAQKAEEESRELYANPCPEEVADLFVVAFAAADRLGMDIPAEIYKKYAILLERGETQLERDRERGIIQASEMKGTSQ